MSKLFGLCVNNCDIIDDENNVKKLEISDLVQILFKIDENMFSIKMNHSGANFDKTIYTCNCKNIAVVSNDLVPFLVGADYWGRLDILRFKKRVEKFKVGSTGNLQVVYDNRRYFIEYVINYIGPVSTIGEGFYVGILLTIPDIPNKKALVQGLYRKYNNRNDQNSSFLTVGVDVLFSEIELDEHFLTYETSPIQSVSLSKEQSIVENSVKEYGSIQKIISLYEAKSINEQHFENPTAMEVDVPQDNSSQLMKTTEERAKNNSEIMKRIEIEKLGKKNPKMCMICMKIFDTKGDLFIFSCNHKFCVKCVLDRLDDVKRDNTSCCPICGETLKGKSKLEALNNFVQNSFSGEETCSPQSHKKGLNYNIRQKNDNKKLNYLSGNRKAFDSNEKVHSGSSGNKIEIRYCKNCNTINKYSDTFCKDCRRPLTANDYSFISVGKES